MNCTEYQTAVTDTLKMIKSFSDDFVSYEESVLTYRKNLLSLLKDEYKHILMTPGLFNKELALLHAQTIGFRETHIFAQGCLTTDIIKIPIKKRLHDYIQLTNELKYVGIVVLECHVVYGGFNKLKNTHRKTKVLASIHNQHGNQRV